MLHFRPSRPGFSHHTWAWYVHTRIRPKPAYLQGLFGLVMRPVTVLPVTSLEWGYIGSLQPLVHRLRELSGQILRQYSILHLHSEPFYALLAAPCSAPIWFVASRARLMSLSSCESAWSRSDQAFGSKSDPVSRSTNWLPSEKMAGSFSRTTKQVNWECGAGLGVPGNINLTIHQIMLARRRARYVPWLARPPSSQHSPWTMLGSLRTSWLCISNQVMIKHKMTG